MAGGDRLFDDATRKRPLVRTGFSEGVDLARYGSARLAARPHLGLAAHIHGADGDRGGRLGRFAGNAFLLVADSFYRSARHLSPSRQKKAAPRPRCSHPSRSALQLRRSWLPSLSFLPASSSNTLFFAKCSWARPAPHSSASGRAWPDPFRPGADPSKCFARE